MTPDVTVDPSLRIPVNGETVAATRFSPRNGDGSHPAILWTTPYHKEREQFARYGSVLQYFAMQGYEVVLANLVGTGASSGRFQGLSAGLGDQCAGIVEWLAAQSWTTGRVGTIGKSAAGFSAFATAAADPDPLAVAVPIMHPASPHRAIYAGGGLYRDYTMLGIIAAYAVQAAIPSTRRDDAGEWRDRWEERLASLREEGPGLIGLPGVFSDDQPDYEISPEAVSVPTLAIGGYRDTFAAETIDIVRRIDAPSRLIMGPWRHTLPHRGRETVLGVRPLVVDWFDQFLKDEANDVLDAPATTFWTEHNGGRQVDQGAWRGRATWPTAASETAPMTYTVTANGLTRGDTLDGSGVEETYTFNQTVGVASFEFGADCQETSPDDARSLVFESSRLSTPVEWTGSGQVTIQLIPHTSAGVVYTRVMDVAPDGRARLVTRGGQRLGEGPEAVPIEPDEQGPVHVDLRPKSHVFEAGHRLRLAISAADMPRHFPIGPDGEFTVVSEPEAPTTVSFPGELEPPVPHPDEITVPEPDDRLPFGPPGVEDQEVTGATTRGHHDGSLSFRREVHADTTYEAVDRTVSVSRDVSVTADDPESVAGELRYTSELHYPTEPVKVTAETKMTREALELSLTVTVDGDPKFDATWAE